MADEHDRIRDDAQMLLRPTGLDLSGEELERVIALYERFAGDRVRLASIALGDTEPATTFHASRQDIEP